MTPDPTKSIHNGIGGTPNIFESHMEPTSYKSSRTNTEHERETNLTDPNISKRELVEEIMKLLPDHPRKGEVEKLIRALPEYMQTLIVGLSACGDSRVPIEQKPQWYDEGKFYKGQKVAMKYLYGMAYSVLLATFLIYNLPEALASLIFTGRSDTPFKAFKRYLSTISKAKSWYTDDIWDPKTEGHKNLRFARSMHEQVRSRMQSTEKKQLEKKTSLQSMWKSIWSPLYLELREDFKATCRVPDVTMEDVYEFSENRVPVNQTEMAILQFSFIGFFSLYPSWFGARNITEEELDCLLHMWATLGHMLGIEDRYNFCLGSVKTVKQRSSDMLEFGVKPSFHYVSPEWEHMMRCLIEGISYYAKGLTFEPLLLYLCDILELDMPRLRASLTFRQRISYYIIYIFNWAMNHSQRALRYFNREVSRSLKRANNPSPEWIRKLQSKKYPFQQIDEQS